MKILVPSDFSKSSNNAALYAAKFAKQIKAEVILLHVVHFEHPPMVQVFSSIEDTIKDVRISEASKDCLLLINELKLKVEGLDISFEVISGFPVHDAIEIFVENNEIDLIIIGTKLSNSLSRLLIGSTGINVISKSSVPVLSVPKFSDFNDVKRIVFAFEKHINQSEIFKIISLAKLFGASIYILHVLSPESKIDSASIENFLIEEYKDQNISFHTVHSNHILAEINEFVYQIKADILAMCTHKIGFFEGLFKTNLSTEEVFHSLVPLLTLKMIE